MRPQLPEGHTVKYYHRRMALGGGGYIGEQARQLIAPDPKGGETEAKVFGAHGSLLATGVATCHERDNFCRRIGRDIALGRALKNLAARPATDPRPEIWDPSEAA